MLKPLIDLCHPEPFGFAEDKLREKSHSCPKPEDSSLRSEAQRNRSHAQSFGVGWSVSVSRRRLQEFL